MTTTGISGIYIPIRGDYTKFQEDMARARAVAREQGKAVSDALNNAISSDSATKALSSLTQKLALAQRGLTAGTFRGNIEGLDELAKVARVSKDRMSELTEQLLRAQAASGVERAFAQLQRQLGASNLAMAKMRAELGDYSGALKSIGSAAVGAAPAVIALGTATAFAAKAAFDADLRMEKLRKAYESVTGSSAGAVEELRYIYETTQRLGLQFQTTAEAARNFFAASRGTGLEKDARGIFEAVSQAGAALSLSQDDMRGIMIAISQMMSKGKVQAEELRGQLGERLPGAFQLAARAMGVTTAELDKMLEQGQVVADDLLPKLARVLREDFKGGASEAQSAVNALSTEWERFLASASQTDLAVKGINAVKSALKDANDAMLEAAQRRAIIAEMQGAGIKGKELLGEGQYGYSQAQIDAYIARKQAGNRQRDGWFSDQPNQAAVLDAALGSARKLSNEFLKNTDAAKVAKINAEYEATARAINDVIAKLRDAGQETGDWQSQLVAAAKERDEQIAKVGKNEVTAANKSADAMREVREEYLRLAGDNSALAREQFDQKFTKWARAIGQVTPEMAALRAEAERAFAIGMTPQQYDAALDSFRQKAREVAAELEEYAAATSGGRKLDPAEAIRTKTSADVAKFKLSKEYAAASPEERDALTGNMLALGNAKAQQSSAEINERFLADARTTLKNRTDLERDALAEQYNLYSKHVQNQALLAEWLKEQERRMSREGVDGMSRALDDYANEATNAAKNIETAIKNSFGSMEDALVSFVTKGKLDFSSFVDSIIADMARAAVRQNITGPLAGMLGGLDLGGLFSLNAHGAVYSAPSLSAHSNSIVDSPTVFPFAKGIGLMGEAGAEAIMPLTRTSGGDLGVKADLSGAGGPQSVEVRVYNEGQQQVAAKRATTTMDNGKMIVALWLREFDNDTMGIRSRIAGG
jgi:lambda family phage tail tape measure protein